MRSVDNNAVIFSIKVGKSERGVCWSPNIGAGFRRDNSGQGHTDSNTTPCHLHFHRSVSFPDSDFLSSSESFIGILYFILSEKMSAKKSLRKNSSTSSRISISSSRVSSSSRLLYKLYLFCLLGSPYPSV